MLDLERFRLLKAMEDKNTPKKKEDKNFPRHFRKKKILSKKHQRKRTSVMDGGRKEPKKKRMFNEVTLPKGD